MRVYDYTCDKCGTTSERFVRDSDVKSVPCEEAGCDGRGQRELCTPRFTLDPNDKAGFPTAYANWDKHHKDKRAAAKPDTE